ncbi:MAG: hypothetical protein J2P23_11625, partial [Microlunatus sp.]|nr:hypothetical protein [Microlunatus sp.]
MLSSRRAAAVLLSVILGCSAVAGCSTTPESDLPHPPWKRGQEITPVSTTNAEVASASRRDQWVQAWLALRPLGGGSSEQVDGETNFDQNLIKAGAGYRAGLSVIRTADPALTLSFAEFDTADHARAQLAKWTAAGPKASEHPATIPGTQQAKAYTQPTGTAPCRVDRGKPIDVSVRFLVADRVAVDLRQSCVSSARTASVIT